MQGRIDDDDKFPLLGGITDRREKWEGEERGERTSSYS